MIGLYNCNEKQKITQHLTNYVQNKEIINQEMDELKQKIENSATSCKEQSSKLEKLLSEVEQVKEALKNAVNSEDLNDLVEDVRNSFELFLNNTPRQNQIEQQLKAVEQRINDLEGRTNAFFGNGEIEFINTDNIPKEINKEIKKGTGKVPKLHIQKRN